MINLDSITNENNKECNEKCPFIPDHPYRTLIIGGSGSGKTNVLLNLIKEQDHINKIYQYAKDLCEPKYEFWSKGAKMLEQNISIIQMYVLSLLIQWTTFMRILMITTQGDKEKFWLFLITWLRTLWWIRGFKP